LTDSLFCHKASEVIFLAVGKGSSLLCWRSSAIVGRAGAPGAVFLTDSIYVQTTDIKML